MEFFSGFKWAVPKAFSEAVSQCRFEEGDILYDTEKAYGADWEKASKHVEYSLQVKYPQRVTGGTPETAGGVFRKNWNSELRIELYKRFGKVGVGQIHTTQGRLYTALWRGDISFFGMDSEEPKMPLIVQDVTKMLDQTTEKAKELSVGYPVFVLVRDLSNSVSRQKYSRILSVLNEHLHRSPSILSPGNAGLSLFKDIAPTVEIAFFSMNGISSSVLHDLVKKAVYVPSRGAKKDMFRISSHGLIV